MRRLALALVPALALALASCGGEPTPPPAADALVARAAAAMATLETARFRLERAGAPVTVEGLVFESAVGRYAAPSSAEAVLRVRGGDLVLEMGTVSIDERVWLTNPLTGRWEELTPGTGFNPAVIFDPEQGWVPLLTQDLGDVAFVASEGSRHHIRGTVAASRIEVLTAGLASGQAVTVDFWLDPGTGHIRRLEFSTEGEQGRSDWVIELSDFDAEVAIAPPVGG